MIRLFLILYLADNIKSWWTKFWLKVFFYSISVMSINNCTNDVPEWASRTLDAGALEMDVL